MTISDLISPALWGLIELREHWHDMDSKHYEGVTLDVFIKDHGLCASDSYDKLEQYLSDKGLTMEFPRYR